MSFGNKSPKPSSKTVTNDKEGEVCDENVRALGEDARLNLTLDDLLLAGVFHRKAQCSSTRKLYFLNDINKDDNDDKERVDEVV